MLNNSTLRFTQPKNQLDLNLINSKGLKHEQSRR